MLVPAGPSAKGVTASRRSPAVHVTEGSGSAPLGSYDQKTDGTVDPKVAQAIATQLKALPREAVDRFLQKFGVQRIKDLPAAQVEKARAFVEQLQTELAAPAASETEVDPFA